MIAVSGLADAAAHAPQPGPVAVDLQQRITAGLAVQVVNVLGYHALQQTHSLHFNQGVVARIGPGLVDRDL